MKKSLLLLLIIVFMIGCSSRKNEGNVLDANYVDWNTLGMAETGTYFIESIVNESGESLQKINFIDHNTKKVVPLSTDLNCKENTIECAAIKNVTLEHGSTVRPMYKDDTIYLVKVDYMNNRFYVDTLSKDGSKLERIFTSDIGTGSLNSVAIYKDQLIVGYTIFDFTDPKFPEQTNSHVLSSFSLDDFKEKIIVNQSKEEEIFVGSIAGDENGLYYFVSNSLRDDDEVKIYYYNFEDETHNLIKVVISEDLSFWIVEDELLYTDNNRVIAMNLSTQEEREVLVVDTDPSIKIEYIDAQGYITLKKRVEPVDGTHAYALTQFYDSKNERFLYDDYQQSNLLGTDTRFEYYRNEDGSIYGYDLSKKEFVEFKS